MRRDDPTITATTASPAPVRRLTGVLVIADESPVPSPFRSVTNSGITIEIGADGIAVLTLGYCGSSSPEQRVPLPAEVAHALDHALFGVELDVERARREQLEAGAVPCSRCHDDRDDRIGCRPCGGTRLVTAESITARRGRWLTVEDVLPHLHRVPVEWAPRVVGILEYSARLAERYRGTSEEGRLFAVDIQLEGLRGPGWESVVDEEGNEDGPSIGLSANGTEWVSWCAYRPGEPVHDDAENLAAAIDQAVASIAGRMKLGSAILT